MVDTVGAPRLHQLQHRRSPRREGGATWRGPLACGVLVVALACSGHALAQQGARTSGPSSSKAPVPVGVFGSVQVESANPAGSLLIHPLGPLHWAMDVSGEEVLEMSTDPHGTYFGLAHNYGAVSPDGVSLSDFRYDGDNHYLTTRGYLGAKESNPFNIGTRRYNGPAEAPTQVKKYDFTTSIWSEGTDELGRFSPVGAPGILGRLGTIGFQAVEDQTETARGGLFFISASAAGSLSQPFNVWVHGATGSLNIAGLSYLGGESTTMVDHPGIGAATIWAVDYASQPALTICDAASRCASGLDVGWSPSKGSITVYARHGGVETAVAVIDTSASPKWTFLAPVVTPPVTVAALPSCPGVGAGARSFVTDASSATFHAAAVGGGRNRVAVVCDGVGWNVGG